MPDQGNDGVTKSLSREIEELQAVLKIKDELVRSLTTERNDLEKRIKELGQKYMEMLGLYEMLRHEMEGLPSLEEVVKMQSIILQLEQQLKMISKS
ncbi:MAG: hypothetical protein HXX11_13095 [Desulfuromonadales bacterium]|nr:hypothetical protein [Desulfuromonadales bacterium]